jgi:membrane-associated phospholipid phosphatase
VRPVTDSGPDRRQRAARCITDALQPMHVLLAGLTGIGITASATWWSGALWGLGAAFAAGVIPATYINWERKRGTWGDRHVVDRAQRRPVFLVILSSIGVASLVMVLARAPHDILRSMLALWAMTVGLLTINDGSKWKVSVDAAVASAVVTMLAVVGGPWWLPAYALVALVCWTRVVLGYHTVAQTAVGTTLGMATALLWLV